MSKQAARLRGSGMGHSTLYIGDTFVLLGLPHNCRSKNPKKTKALQQQGVCKACLLLRPLLDLNQGHTD